MRIHGSRIFPIPSRPGQSGLPVKPASGRQRLEDESRKAAVKISSMPPKGYGYGQYSKPTIERLKFKVPQAPKDLRNLVRRLLESQGLVFKDLAGLNGIFIIDEKATEDHFMQNEDPSSSGAR